jgi:putative adhesin
MSLRFVGPVVCGVAMSAVVACSSTSGSNPGNPPVPASAGSAASSQSGNSYQLDPAVTTLRFNADAASVDLTAQEGAQAITVTEQTRGATTTKEVSGANAVLTSRCPDGINFGDSCRVEYKVTIPARVAVDIEGAAGDIVLKGPMVKATVKTAAARISGSGLGAGTFQATTTAGEIQLAFAAAPTSVEVKSTAGAVTLVVPGAEKYNVTVDTTIGAQDVSVDKDPSSTHRINVETTVGSVTVKKG